VGARLTTRRGAVVLLGVSRLLDWTRSALSLRRWQPTMGVIRSGFSSRRRPVSRCTANRFARLAPSALLGRRPAADCADVALVTPANRFGKAPSRPDQRNTLMRSLLLPPGRQPTRHRIPGHIAPRLQIPNRPDTLDSRRRTVRAETPPASPATCKSPVTTVALRSDEPENIRARDRSRRLANPGEEHLQVKRPWPTPCSADNARKRIPSNPRQAT
jgi:hypothetical protein